MSNSKDEIGGWGLILMGTMMLLYILGAAVTGSLGLAVFLGNITAYIAHMNVYAAIALWTGIYILTMVIVLGLGIYLEFYS